MLYNDRCDGVISANVYKELASHFELKLKQIIEKIDEEELKNTLLKIIKQYYQIILKR